MKKNVLAWVLGAALFTFTSCKETPDEKMEDNAVETMEVSEPEEASEEVMDSTVQDGTAVEAPVDTLAIE